MDVAAAKGLRLRHQEQIMLRRSMPLTLLLVTILALLGLGPIRSGAQDVLPTPQGQLGGPAPLATAPAQAVSTREPTSTPTDAATPENASSPIASPDLTSAGERDVPPPEECRVAPLDMRLLLDRLAATPGFIETALASPPVTVSTPTPFASPEGEPADDATVAGVSATAREYIACFNANAPAQQLALFTDAYVGRQLAGNLGQPYPDAVATAAAIMTTATAEAAVATPGAPDDAAILAIQDVRVLADGRAAATLIVDPPDPQSPTAFALVFANVGDRWLIDDLVMLPGDPAGA